jgi:dTDP-4-amino-4,6-dideoxygalactose transaminase
MTDIQAAVGIKQLEKLELIVAERRKIAMRYNESFKGLKGVVLPLEAQDTLRNYQSYVLTFKNDSRISRNQFMERMLKEGVATRRGIMTAHRERAYKEICSDVSLPVSECLADNSVILPLFYPMSEETIETVIGTVRRLLT